MKRVSLVMPLAGVLSVVAIIASPLPSQAAPSEHPKSQQKPYIPLNKPAPQKRFQIDSSSVKNLSKRQQHIDSGMVKGLSKRQQQMFGLEPR